MSHSVIDLVRSIPSHYRSDDAFPEFEKNLIFGEASPYAGTSGGSELDSILIFCEASPGPGIHLSFEDFFEDGTFFGSGSRGSSLKRVSPLGELIIHRRSSLMFPMSSFSRSMYSVLRMMKFGLS